MFVEGMIEDALKKALKSAAKRPPPQTAPAPQASASPKPSLAAPPMAPPAPMKTEASRAETPADQPETSENKANTSRLPPPVLEVLAAEQMEVGSQRLNRYPLRIKNWMSLPDEMFEPVKDLPPCGMGASATRLEVVIWSAEGEKLLGYCDLPRAEILQRFWLFLSPGQRPPERIYITLKDRRSGYTIRSNIVALPTVKVGLWVFLAVATSLFSLLISAYHMRMMGDDWTRLVVPRVLWLNSAVLILASVAMQGTRAAARQGQLERVKSGLIASGVLSFSFLAG